MSIRSPRIEQHRQPDDIRMVSSFASSTSRWSRPISPNSLITTAVSAMSGCCSRFLSNVVLPEPRNPVMTETGTAPARRLAHDGALSRRAAQAVQGIEAEREQDKAPACARLPAAAAPPASRRSRCRASPAQRGRSGGSRNSRFISAPSRARRALTSPARSARSRQSPQPVRAGTARSTGFSKKFDPRWVWREQVGRNPMLAHHREVVVDEAHRQAGDEADRSARSPRDHRDHVRHVGTPRQARRLSIGCGHARADDHCRARPEQGGDRSPAPAAVRDRAGYWLTSMWSAKARLPTMIQPISPCSLLAEHEDRRPSARPSARRFAVQMAGHPEP